MIEIVIERYSQRDGTVDWLWSIWQDGQRKHMSGTHDSRQSAEMEARAVCQRLVGRAPDEFTVL